jgi:itaconyl-CoA hydratase
MRRLPQPMGVQGTESSPKHPSVVASCPAAVPSAEVNKRTLASVALATLESLSVTTNGVSSERWWDSFAVGDRYRTESITVTETHVVTWAGLTGDWVPLHVDAEYAAASEFGERIAHGPLTLALALGLATRSGIFGDCVLAWLGLDGLRLPLPVRFGDTIHADLLVRDRRPTSKPGRGLVVLDYAVHNQRDEIVMTFASTFLLRMAAQTVTAELA